jgi:Tol biopolymer transport system component
MLTARRDAGRIAFVSNRTGNNDIHVMRPDGSDVHNLTNNPAGDDFPAWSPDGSRIAFRSNRDGNREIYVMNDDGNDVVRLTFDRAIDTTPSWTPDGMIVFSSNRSGRFELYEMNANGSGLRHIDVELDGRLVSPQVSPEGHRIAFTRGINLFDSAVWIAHRDGSHPIQMTEDSLFAAGASWSPQGNRLAFENNFCPVCDTSHIFVMNQGGNQLTQLGQDEDSNDLFPGWSPDGTQIVFERLTLSTFELDIYVMNADGSGVTNITLNPAVDTLPVWGP